MSFLSLKYQLQRSRVVETLRGNQHGLGRCFCDQLQKSEESSGGRLSDWMTPQGKRAQGGRLRCPGDPE